MGLPVFGVRQRAKVKVVYVGFQKGISVVDASIIVPYFAIETQTGREMEPAQIDYSHKDILCNPTEMQNIDRLAWCHRIERDAFEKQHQRNGWEVKVVCIRARAVCIRV